MIEGLSFEKVQFRFSIAQTTIFAVQNQKGCRVEKTKLRLDACKANNKSEDPTSQQF